MAKYKFDVYKSDVSDHVRVNYKFDVGDHVCVNDPVDCFLHGEEVMIINRDTFADVNVYTVVDRRNWTCTLREEKLIIPHLLD